MKQYRSSTLYNEVTMTSATLQLAWSCFKLFWFNKYILNHQTDINEQTKIPFGEKMKSYEDVTIFFNKST